ncbi:MAG: phage portal protein [Neisseriales bacterium]|jgi:lambda family phage portal protein|nr:MAG: phage portal protein [Neisseriales bacterium]
MKQSLFNKILYAVAPSYLAKRQLAQMQSNFLALYGQNSGTGYGNHGAGYNTSTMGWGAYSTNADSDLIVNRDTLVQRSRDLFMGSSLANGVLKDIAQNVAGGGLTLKSSINYEYLGISNEEAKALEKKIEFEFDLWASKSYCCDLEAGNSFYDMQTLVMLSVLLSGDVFIAMPLKERKNSIYDLKLKIIEADRIMDPNNKEPNKNILGGIELDDDGAPVAYYLVNQLPYAQNYGKIQPTLWKRIPAFGSKTGRRNILHLFNVERPGQRRGIPILSPVMEMFKQLTRYTEAEIMSAIVASSFSVFIKKVNPTQATFDQVSQNAAQRMTGNVGQQTQAPSNYANYRIEPGLVMEMNPNESIEIANPTRPNTGYGDFVDSILKQVAVGLGLPQEYMLKNMNSSYSASRAAIMLAWEMFNTRRKWLVREFCQPVYEEWLSEAVAKSRVNLPGFFDNLSIKAAWSRTNWIGTNPIQIDPVKEVTAAKIRIDECLSTREHEAMKIGSGSFDEILPIREIEEIGMDKVRRTEKPVYVGTVKSDATVNNKKSER